MSRRCWILPVAMLFAGVASRSGAMANPGAPPTRVGQVADAPRAATAGAWERSLALEASNDLGGAKAVFITAYGADTNIYDVCVRLAWLSLRMAQGDEAIALYRKARTLPGALPEATVGLVSALTMSGYQALDRGNLAQARQDWSEALGHDGSNADARRGLDLTGPPSGVAPEVWLAHLSATPGRSTAQTVYVHLPVRVDNRISARAAYRWIGAPGATSTDAAVFGTQQEVYGAVSVERGVSQTEVLGFVLSSALATMPGIAADMRLGGRKGATIVVSGVHGTDGWNAQVAPQAFLWVRPSLALAGGIRMTHDPALSAVSALAGATIRSGRLQVDAAMHAGEERWAFSAAGPTILSFLSSTNWGTTVTAAASTPSRVTVFVQFQVEHLLSGDGTQDAGHYMSAGGGVRWLAGRAGR